MQDLQACLFRYITVAAFRIYLSVVKMLLKGEVGGHVLKSHGNYVFDHGKSWKNHGIVFLWNPVILPCHFMLQLESVNHVTVSVYYVHLMHSVLEVRHSVSVPMDILIKVEFVHNVSLFKPVFACVPFDKPKSKLLINQNLNFCVLIFIF